MAVGNFYQIEGVDAGAPIVGRFLGSYFNTIKDMNDAAMAFEAQDDESAGDLGKMELAARERLTKMTEALQDAKSGDFRSTNDLMDTFMTRKSIETVEGGKIAKDMALGRMDLYGAMQELGRKTNEEYDKTRTLSPENQRVIDNAARQVDQRTADQIAGALVDQFRPIAAMEQAGNAGSPKYRKMVADLYTSLMANGDAKSKAVAEKIAATLLPEAGRQNMSPPDYDESMRPWTPKDAYDMSERIARENRAGLRRGEGVDAAVEAAGMTPRDLRSEGRSESTSTSTKGGAGATPGGGGGRTPADVAVKMEGFSPDAARAFAAAPDMYAGLQAAIDAQSRYADELAQRAQEARGRKRSLYPRPNVYTVTPNQMATQRWQDAVYNVGNRDYPARPQRDVVFEAATDEENPAQARDWKGQTPEKGPEVATRADLDAIYGYTPGPAEKFASMRPKGAADADPMYDFDTFLSEPTAKKEPDPMADFDAFLE